MAAIACARLARRLADSAAFVDLLGPMRAARDGPVPLYYLTDTHWNHEGCLLAYRVLMRACGAVVPPDLDDRPRFDSERVRDLGEKMPARPIETREPGADRARRRAQLCQPAGGRLRGGGPGRLISTWAPMWCFRNESPAVDPRTLVLFGDSYAHFAPIMLTGLLAESFREVHFVWSASIDWNYVEKVRPDLLVFEIAERFIVRLPDDTFDIASHGDARGPRRSRRPPPLPVSETV